MTRKTKRFFRKIKLALIRLAVCAVLVFLAVFAICFILSLPEIICGLIFGF